jgi:hypothetical protein
VRTALILLIGLLVGCLVIAGLAVFKDFVSARAMHWAAQQPPPELTLGMRALLHAGNFVASYWVFASLFLLPLSVGAAGVIAYRKSRTSEARAAAAEARLPGSSPGRFELAASTIFLAVAVLSLLLGLLLIWAGGSFSRSTHISSTTLSGTLLATFLFPLASLLGFLFALVLAVWKRRRQFVLELVISVVLLAFLSLLGSLLPQ